MASSVGVGSCPCIPADRKFAANGSRWSAPRDTAVGVLATPRVLYPKPHFLSFVRSGGLGGAAVLAYRLRELSVELGCILGTAGPVG